MRARSRTSRRQGYGWQEYSGANDGVALIIVLGMLAVLTLLSVAFAISMRVERLAARNHVNLVRAQYLVQTALVRAYEDIDKSMAKMCYPTWDAKNSYGSEPMNDFLTGEASNVVPKALWDAATTAEQNCCWMDIVHNGTTHGRIAYIAINTSGLLDVNYVGGATPDTYTNVNELDVSAVPEMASINDFHADRTTHRRYETITELAELNTGLDNETVSNFVTYSYDPGRDLYFSNTITLGARTNALYHKFCINSITNYACWNNSKDYDKYSTDTAFTNNYWTTLRNYLAVTNDNQEGVERPDDVAWNIVNWLDVDRVPQSLSPAPWGHTEGGEALPLINEVVLSNVVANTYRFYVEIWYPYVPVVIQPSDNFYARIVVATNNTDCNPPAGDRDIFTVNGGVLLGQTETNLPNMAYGTTSEFAVVTCDFTLPGGPLSDSNSIWFLAQTLIKDGSDLFPVDLASAGGDRTFCMKTNIGNWSCNDPRTNGKPGDWYAEPDSHKTLGAVNYNDGTGSDSTCDPWKWPGVVGDGQRSGHPMYCRDGLMNSIGDLGYIFRANIQKGGGSAGGDPGRYQTFDLMNRYKGSFFMDRFTTRDTNAPARGLISINTRQKDVLRTLFHNMKFGWTNSAYTNKLILQDSDIENLITVIFDQRPSIAKGDTQEGWISFQDMFWRYDEPGYDPDNEPGGPVATAFRAAAKNASNTQRPGQPINDKILEDPFRQITHMITFRQNLFTVLVAAQVLGPDGTTPMAEKRAVATIVRDAYTGRHFLRSFKWLLD